MRGSTAAIRCWVEHAGRLDFAADVAAADWIGRADKENEKVARPPAQIDTPKAERDLVLPRSPKMACYHAPMYRACTLRAVAMSLVPATIVRPSGNTVST